MRKRYRRSLTLFDEAVRRTAAIVDMPDRRASLLARLIIQNKGTLAQGKRRLFAELTKVELAAIESAVRGAMKSLQPEPADGGRLPIKNSRQMPPPIRVSQRR